MSDKFSDFDFDEFNETFSGADDGSTRFSEGKHMRDEMPHTPAMISITLTSKKRQKYIPPSRNRFVNLHPTTATIFIPVPLQKRTKTIGR